MDLGLKGQKALVMEADRGIATTSRTLALEGAELGEDHLREAVASPPSIDAAYNKLREIHT
jgi:hypothetical protein